MPSNFDFLDSISKDIFTNSIDAEKHVFSAPRTSVFYARRSLELSVSWMYENDISLRKPFQDSLAAMIHEHSFIKGLPPGMFSKLQLIRKLGNIAVHSNTQIKQEEAVIVLKGLWSFLQWFAVTYHDAKAGAAQFDEKLIERTSEADKRAAELAEIQRKLSESDEIIKQREKQLADYEKELEKRQADVAKRKKKNKASADRVSALINDNLSEDATRDLIIDVMLREVGWDPKAKDVAEFRVSPFENKSNEGFVDYVLWGDDGLPLALVEAKKTKRDPKVGKRQAELYANSLEKMFGVRPVIFYSNGYTTWMWDDKMYPPREVSGFYTKDELAYLIQKRTTRTVKIGKEPIPNDIVDRYYQKDAIKAVLDTFEKKQRKALLVMATGTGKTRVSIALTDILMKHNWARRVLFLADRTALVKQAKKNFVKHLPNLSTTNLTNEVENEKTRVIFSTYPTMMNAIDDTKKDSLKRFSPGYFDLIIIDEAHRSTYNKYEAIFKYFDAMLIGLTATPKADMDKNTYDIFDLQANVPTHAYELEQGIADGYLVPFKSIPVPMKFQSNGIRYEDLSKEEREAYEESFIDEETGEMPDRIDSSELFRWVYNKDTVNKVITFVMETGIKIQGGDKLGKTIVFAKNTKHAHLINSQFDLLYPDKLGKFTAVVAHEVNYSDTIIDAFSDKDKEPTMAISVDMLDTGIDIHEIVNLVFFKRVESKAKFWQMIGRGTRTCPDLFGPGKSKTHFQVFDFCGVFDFFSQNPEGVESRAAPSLSQSIFTKRMTLLRHLTETDKVNENFKKALVESISSTIGRLDSESFVNRPYLKYIETYKVTEKLKSLSEGEFAEISEQIKPLITPDDSDELARRFDNLILGISVEFLQSGAVPQSSLRKLEKIAKGLKKKKNIPSIADNIGIVDSILGSNFLRSVSLDSLESIRVGLRDLIKLLDQEDGKEDVYTDFEDEILVHTVVEGPTLTHNLNLEDYKDKLKAFLHSHKENLTLYKIRNNKRLGDLDIKELETILFENDPKAKTDFEKIFGRKRPLTVFARQTVGMERPAVMEMFSEILSKVGLSKTQSDFLMQIVDHIAHNGLMEVASLYDSPFTNYHSASIDGLFPNDVDNIISIIEKINETAYVHPVKVM